MKLDGVTEGGEEEEEEGRAHGVPGLPDFGHGVYLCV